MTSGRVVAADRRPVEANLTADVLAADTVLPVTDASVFAEEDDFAEGPQWVVIGNGLNPVEYVATDTESSPETITLADPVGDDLEAGLPVTMWDPSVQIDDKRSVEIVVKVALDEHPGEVPITASVDHAMVPLSGIDSLVGAQVTLADDDFDQWRVANVPGRASVVDSGYVQTPTVRARLVTSTPLAAGVWDTVMLTSSEKQDFDYDPGTGVFTALRDGVYVLIFHVSFEPNANNARALRARVYYLDGTNEALQYVRAAAVDSVTALQVTYGPRLRAGEGVSFEAHQTSGATLNLLGTDVDRTTYAELGQRPTEVTIYRSAT